MQFKLHITRTELGLWFRNGDLKGVLAPGAWFIAGRLFGRDRVEVVNTLNTRVTHPKLDALLLEESFREHVIVSEVQDSQRAIYTVDGRTAGVLGSGRHVFWARPRDVRIETVSTESVRFTHPQLDAILRAPGAQEHLEAIRVDERERAVLFVDGQIESVLEPGLHAFWRTGVAGKIIGKRVDLRETTSEVNGQEIMTKDRVTLRATLLVTWRVVDARMVVTEVADHTQAIYREAQLVLRAVVGTRTLEQLLADKAEVSAELREVLVARAATFGVRVVSIGVRDLILPGEMKTILNQVIEAQKQAEANLIRRREETAAARSQANTARLLAENPALVRMKELEALQEILAGANVSFVFGSGDVSEQVRALVGSPDAPR